MGTRDKMRRVNEYKFGSKYHQIRIHFDKSQEQFAKELEISYSFASEIENDKKPPNLMIIRRLCLLYGLAGQYLLDDKEYEQVVFEHQINQLKNENAMLRESTIVQTTENRLLSKMVGECIKSSVKGIK